MIELNDITVHKASTILNELEQSIVDKTSFGLVRFGDGTIKAIHAYLNDDKEQLKQISIQEGIPLNTFGKIIEFWKTSANFCNYIDSPEVYFSNKFWKRTRKDKKQMSEKTIYRLTHWKDLYSVVGITNTNYCNPEINFLSCIRYGSNKTLPDIMCNRKVCCITSNLKAEDCLKNFNIEVIRIPSKNNNQFLSFNRIIEQIKERSTHYDLWLVAAGELGRMYPGLIKFTGGRSFDIGSLVDFWCSGEIPVRLIPYLQKTENPFELSFTEEGLNFLEAI